MKASYTEEAIGYHIKETQELIAKKKQEYENIKISSVIRVIYEQSNVNKPHLQIHCLQRLLSLLIELRDSTGHKNQICNKIKDLALGRGANKTRYYVATYPLNECSELTGLYCFVPPENGVLFFDRTAKRFHEARETVEYLIKRGNEDTELTSVTYAT